MIADFVSSWALFGTSYVTGWLIAVLLAGIGVLVVARDQIFVGAAIAEASLLGIALGMHAVHVPALVAIGWADSDLFLSASAGVFALLAALATSWAGRRAPSSHESVTGWIFLVGASLSVLVLAHSPHGTEEIHRLVASTIIGAREADVVVFAALLAAVAAAIFRWRAELILLAMDREMAAAVGLRVTRWSIAMSIALGITIGLANRVSGLVFTFGCLVLPALVARHLCREVRTMLLVAPLIALAATIAGFVAANHYDLPPGQTAVAILCGLPLIARPVRALRALVRP